jgi:peptidoglycan-associated lipoprotein
MPMVKPCLPFLVLAIAGVGCHTRPPATAPARTVAPPPPTVPASPPAPPPRASAPVARPAAPPLTEAELFGRKSLDELNGEHPLGDPFFDYDQDALRDDARRVLQQDAQWLARWPQTVIRVDGHCDERGTGEYNLALGERRATAIKDYLASLGVRTERIQVRSLGKEAPFCNGDGESCWSQNRRGHVVITAK